MCQTLCSTVDSYGLEGRLTLDQVIHKQTVVTCDMGTVRINLG